MISTAVIAIAQNPCNETTIDSTFCYLKKKYVPPSKIVLEKKVTGIDSFISTYNSPLVVDLNGDCLPELLMPYAYRDLTIIDPLTGKTLDTIITPPYKSDPTGFALADVDKDGVPEIFVASKTGIGKNSARIFCYKINGTIKWISDQYHNDNSIDQGNLAFADFNQDGIPEIYIRNKIFNAQTGVFLCDGGIMVLGLPLTLLFL